MQEFVGAAEQVFVASSSGTFSLHHRPTSHVLARPATTPDLVIPKMPRLLPADHGSRRTALGVGGANRVEHVDKLLDVADTQGFHRLLVR